MNKKLIMLTVAAMTVITAVFLAGYLYGAARTDPYPITTTTPPTDTQQAQAENINLSQVAEPTPEPDPTRPRIFPSLHITTEGEPFIYRELWLPAVLTMTDTSHTFADITGRVRGRGNTSWTRLPDKRPMRIRFDTAQPMLGSWYAARDWSLIANHSDKSLMRNFAAYDLGSRLDGMTWTASAKFLHLYVNDGYMGVYMLTDQVEVGPGRATLTFDPDPTVSEYFLEMDWRAYRTLVEGERFIRVNTSPDGISGDSRHTTYGPRDMLFEFRFPRMDREPAKTADHVEYARVYMDAVGRAIRARDFERIAALIDIDSFVDYFIVQEMFRNFDSAWSSMMLQIRGQGDNRRLHLGPVWDFDVAANNVNWSNNPGPYGGLYMTTQHYWWLNLLRVPEFLLAVHDRWNTVGFDAAMATIDRINYMKEHYQEEFERNFERHQILGQEIWPVPEPLVAIDTFAGQVDYLTDFLYRRANHLTETLDDMVP